MSRRYKVHEGELYGNYIVVSSNPIKGKDGKTCFECRCSCGVLEIVRGNRLYKSGFVGCHKCRSTYNYNLYTKCKWDASRPKYVGDISGTYFSHVKQLASSRNIPFKLTKEVLWDLFLAQDKKCALTGRDITLSTDRKKSDPDFSKISASLDRIDSRGIYEIGNVQWVHKHVNVMKWNLSQEDFIKVCIDVVNRHANTEPSSGTLNSTEKVQRIVVEEE